MNQEIECKFLVENSDFLEFVSSSKEITQGYFVSEVGVSIRIRLIDEKAIFCIKGHVKNSVGRVRNEFEYEIPRKDGEFMLENYCKNRIIKKIRHYVNYKGFTWEVDQFLDCYQGLIVAEIELPTVDTQFEKPVWVGKDVTGDYRYTNSFMAKNLLK